MGCGGVCDTATKKKFSNYTRREKFSVKFHENVSIIRGDLQGENLRFFHTKNGREREKKTHNKREDFPCLLCRERERERYSPPLPVTFQWTAFECRRIGGGEPENNKKKEIGLSCDFRKIKRKKPRCLVKNFSIPASAITVFFVRSSCRKSRAYVLFDLSFSSAFVSCFFGGKS